MKSVIISILGSATIINSQGQPWARNYGKSLSLGLDAFSGLNIKNTFGNKRNRIKKEEEIEAEAPRKLDIPDLNGLDGSRGRDGIDGHKGKRGERGPRGPQGAKGPKGDKGEPGVNGYDGHDGEKGLPGLPGKDEDCIDDKDIPDDMDDDDRRRLMKGKVLCKKDVIGPKGIPGDIGIPGKDGLNGVPGSNGKDGYQGLKGQPGQNGYDGVQGSPGYKGPRGEPGDDGDVGLPGPPGPPAYDDGDDYGEPGLPGPPGPPGPCGCPDEEEEDIYYDDFDYPGSKKDDFLDIGYGDDTLGKGKSLSGKSSPHGSSPAAEYDPYGRPLKKYNDGYNHNSYKVPNTLLSAKALKQLPVRKKRGDKFDEDKKFKSESLKDKKASVAVDTDRERKQEGYNDNLEYAGKEVFADEAANSEAFVKGEAYENEKDIAQRKDSLYGGDALYQQDKVSTDAKVAFEVDHSLRFKNDYSDENHRGQYKGDEFDVSYKASDIQGGYSANELDREAKSAGYKGINSKGEFNEAGKYYDDDYEKYGKDEKDLRFRDKQYGNVKLPGKGGSQGPPVGVPPVSGGSMYDRFKGQNKGKHGGPVYTKGHVPDGQYGKNGYRTFYPYGERLNVKKDKENEDKYRANGNNFEGKDYFQDRQETEAYAGSQDKLKERKSFDKGNYRDVAAKGKNKQASYAGDYQTNKKAQNVDFNVKHFEDLKQDLNQDIKSDQYYAKYEGEDNKAQRQADSKFGKYKDSELKRKQDALINAKRYNGNDNWKFDKVEDEAKIYLKSKNDAIREQELKAKPHGYRGEDRRPRRHSRYGDRYGSRYGKNGDDDNDRRRMLIVNSLRNDIASLQTSKILSKNEILLMFITLSIAALFGAALTNSILKLLGYKFVSKENNKKLDNYLQFPMPN